VVRRSSEGVLSRKEEELYLMAPQMSEVVVSSRESGVACRTDDPFMLWKVSMGPNVTS
jgi:hypothetical protein